MPRRAKKPCAKIGCPNLVESPNRYCSVHKHIEDEAKQEHEKRRGSASSRGYNSRWRKRRLMYLREHPICECKECKELGRIRPSTVVDHIIPHKGNYELFWDENNWQAMSKHCHDRKTAREDGGFGNKRK